MKSVIMVTLAGGHIAPLNVFAFRQDAEIARNEFNQHYKDNSSIVPFHALSEEMQERAGKLPVIQPEYARCCMCGEYIDGITPPALKKGKFCSWRCADELYDFS